VNELNKLKSIEEIRFKANPLNLEFDRNAIRQLLVAKIEKLSILNRTIVDADERRGSEIDYLRKVGKELAELIKNNKDDNDINLFKSQNHPRYDALALSEC
jgi:hypothetical protein